MPYIQLRERQYPLGKGQLRVGTGAHADIRVPGAEGDATQAVVEVGQDEQATVRRGSPDAIVKVNGVLLGGEPTPLIHGDKIEIGGVELLFGDDRSAGSTQYLGVPGAGSRASGPAPDRVTATSGGRLVSLVDGREYMIGDAGVTIGRDASCEVVVPATEVSRRHANISPGPGGYVLTDLSTNGVLVNGERVPKTRILGRGDMIRIGSEEFRFHADAAGGKAEAAAARGHMNATIAHPAARISPAPSSPAPASAQPASRAPASPPRPAPAPEPGPTPASAPSVSAAAPVHPAALAEAASGAPAGQGAARHRAPLAIVEILNEGVLKGKRFEILTPLTHVGRGAHNDIAIADDSVSDSHAKIQKRETGWFVVDMDSTNGTYVGGRRITGERQLIGSPDIRFGGIKMVFQVAAEPIEDAKATRAITGMPRAQPRPASTPATQPAAAPSSMVTEPVEPPPAGRGLGWVILGIVVLVIGTTVFVLWGRG
jgi:pSer/pThr/pTyr-binding forkhead associated (FHA) protein